MKTRFFTYKKKKDGSVKDYSVIILDEDEDHINGLVTSYLDQDELKSVTASLSKTEKAKKDLQQRLDNKEIGQSEFDELIQNINTDDISPYIKKSFRCFLKENIVDPQK